MTAAPSDFPLEPDFGEIRQALARLGTAPPFDRFCAEIEPLFRKILSSEQVLQFLRGELAQLADDPAAQIGEAVGRPGAFFLQPEGRLGLLQVSTSAAATRDALEGQASHRLLAALTGRISVARFRHEQPQFQPVVFDASEALTPIDTREAASGDVVRVEASRDVVQVTGRGLLLEIRSAPVSPVRWVYDPITLRPKATVAANRQLGRIEDGLEMLTHIGTSEDATVAASLARHPAHFIRWAALRAAVALNPGEGRKLVECALTDAHPHVRNAATRALKDWESDDRSNSDEPSH